MLVNTIWMVMTFVAFLLAIGLHYGAQALVATVLGDTSIARDRRLTFDPRRHLAGFGTAIAVVASFSFVFPAGIGWGRIIRPDSRRLRAGPNVGVILIALAGIAANILFGLLIGFALSRIPASTHDQFLIGQCSPLGGGPLQDCLQAWQPGWILRIAQFAYILAAVNVTIGIFNVIPLFPLDGYHILFTLLPDRTAINFRNSEQWQELILALIIFLIPTLLALSRVPLSFNPLIFFQSLGFSLVNSVAGDQFALLVNL